MTASSDGIVKMPSSLMQKIYPSSPTLSMKTLPSATMRFEVLRLWVVALTSDSSLIF